jgi:hypothetical protein
MCVEHWEQITWLQLKIYGVTEVKKRKVVSVLNLSDITSQQQAHVKIK